MQDNNTDPIPESPGRLNLEDGGDGFNVLAAIQKKQKVRSRSQIQFNSLDSENEDAKRLVDEIASHYQSKSDTNDPFIYILPTGQSCKKELYDEILPKIRTFETVNKWLYDEALLLSNPSNGYLLDNYQKISDEKGEPDLEIPKFTANMIVTKSALTFAKKAKEVLDANQPLSVSVCSYKIYPEEGSGCGNHAMTLVGAAYVNGKCNVRLKNSWGTSATSDGYKTIDVNTFLYSMQETGKFGANWVSKADVPNIAIRDEYTFEGTMKISNTLFNYPDGIMKYSDGGEAKYENGLRTSLKNYLFRKNSTDRYTGTIAPNGYFQDGVITDANGNEIGHFKNGRTKDYIGK